MTTITALPTPPSRSDPTNFRSRGDAFMAALPTFATETNTVAGEVNANAAIAIARADTATLMAAEAAASAVEAQAALSAASVASNASAWVSGTTYTEGAVVWSPSTHTSYRRKSTGGGTTDPAADPTNWVSLSSAMPTVVEVSGTTQTALAGMHYVLINASATTVTLPASPSDGDTIIVTVANARADNVIARGGKEINGIGEDMTITSIYGSVWLRYISAATQWRIV
jgi:hypothetical protein